ncbi:MAG: leucine-rich repeat protein, partial [Verrucomicrobiae bacterium]
TSGTISANSSQDITVSFNPTVEQSYSGAVTVASDMTGGTNTAAISGDGAPVPTRVIVLSGNLTFGSAMMYSQITSTMKISNTGNTELTITDISYPVGFSGNWTSGTIAANSSRDVTVSFSPTAVQQYNGTISVNSDSTSGTGTISASGQGAIPLTYADLGSSVIITGYLKDGYFTMPAGVLNIPSTINGHTVTGIADYAFQNCVMTSVTISEGVTGIGYGAFAGCRAMTSVTIPSSVTMIGKYAFGYSGLTSVTIPYSVTNIGEAAFGECSEVTAFNVDSANQNYSSADGVLFNKIKTTLIQYPAAKAEAYTIPSSVTSIGNYAFANYSGLTSVTIPSSVTSIGNYAFAGCSGLTSVTIPYSVTNIGEAAFVQCSKVTAFNVDSANQNYSSADGVLFNKLKTTLIQYLAAKAGAYTIPSSVTSIGNYAFANYSGLTSVTIPSSVTSIGNYAFAGCSGLTSVTIPSSVTFIAGSAFSACGRLKTAQFSGNAPTIGTYVFRYCATGFTVYYFNNATGFTSPTWNGYPSVNMGAYSPIAPWLLSKGFAYNENLLSIPNNDGVPLLMAYALNLDPTQNQGRSMPVAEVAGNQLQISFYAGSTGIAYTVETSTDLKNWTPIGVVLSAPDSNQFQTASIALDGPHRFLRLVVRK